MPGQCEFVGELAGLPGERTVDADLYQFTLFRAGLDDDQLDERGGVEVQDQRRCSATRSETEPRAFTFARRELRARVG